MRGFEEWYGVGMNGRPVACCYIGLDGKPVKRTPRSDPYGYDDFVLYKDEDFKETDNWVYSDRMIQWDSKAFDNAVNEVWPENPGSQMFYGKAPEELTRFLSLYFGKEVKLTAVMQGCNRASGYPYWIFAYREEAELIKKEKEG